MWKPSLLKKTVDLSIFCLSNDNFKYFETIITKKTNNLTDGQNLLFINKIIFSSSKKRWKNYNYFDF